MISDTWARLAAGACAAILLLSPLARAQDAREMKNAADARAWNAAPAPADPRDLQGVWQTRGYDRTFRPIANPPLDPAEAAGLLPLTPLEAASRARRLDMEKAGAPIADASTDCFTQGVPRVMASPYPIQIDYQPGLIVILHEVGHNVRFIHMDGKPAPARNPLTDQGYSRGRWVGETLVIDTDHFNDKTQIDEESLSHGLKLTVHEEITKFSNKYGGVELRDLITISDPDHYTHPWTTERLYPWRGDVRLRESSCGQDSNTPLRPPPVPASAPAPVRGAPNLSGKWINAAPQAPLRTLGGGPPPLNARGKAAYASHRAHRKDDPLNRCLMHGEPRLLFSRYPFLIMQSGAHVDFLHAANHTFRITYFGGALDPDADPAWLGHSAARWEGRTLVIDSNRYNAETWLDYAGLPHGDKLVTQETYTLAAGGRTIRGTVRIEDPDFYAKPWTAPFTLNRQPGVGLEQYSCMADHRM